MAAVIKVGEQLHAIDPSQRTPYTGPRYINGRQNPAASS
jgi:hypothetical protein